jgi:thymidylate synthase
MIAHFGSLVHRPQTADDAWRALLLNIYSHGAVVSPRGRKTLELPQMTMAVDMRFPVVLSPARKLSYRFMAAEAYWILSGSDQVDGIAPYNPNIAQFSDDGVKFDGAYGPMVTDQMTHVVRSLTKDKDSRQATLTIWRPNPKPSKDIPCTVAMSFMIRGKQLNCHVYMRSSDAWLGVPYDIFNFTMITCEVMARLSITHDLTPGTLFLTAASSHLYLDKPTNEELRSVLSEPGITQFHQVPEVYYRWMGVTEGATRHILKQLRETKKGDPMRWWEESRPCV